jgi:hypothetical protein
MGTCYLTCKQIPDSKELLTSRDNSSNTKEDLTKTLHTKETTNIQEHSLNPHYIQANNLNTSEFFGTNNELLDSKDPMMPSYNLSAIEPNGNSLYIGKDERNELIKLCQIESNNNDMKCKERKNKKKKKGNNNNKIKTPSNIKNKHVNVNMTNSNSYNKYKKK